VAEHVALKAPPVGSLFQISQHFQMLTTPRQVRWS